MEPAGGASAADAMASGQHGVIRREQAIAAGLGRQRIDDLVRRRRWLRAYPSVYRVGRGPLTTAARIHAAALWAGETAVVGGQAAAWWWGLAPLPGLITLIVPPPCRRPGRPGVMVIRGTVDPRDVVLRDGLPVTTVARTCLDLARAGEPDRLDTALRLGLTDPAQLRRSLDRGRGRRGQLLARLALDEARAAPWSFRERLLHRYLRDAGIVGWTPNPAIRLRHGPQTPDIALEELRLALVMHGRQVHSGVPPPAEWAGHNDFVEAGWTVLHFTWNQLTDDGAAMMSALARTVAVLRQRRRFTMAEAGS